MGGQGHITSKLLRQSIPAMLIPAMLILWFITGCGGPDLPADDRVELLDRQAHIYPNYSEITIPSNIAPLNFALKEEGDRFLLVMEGESGTRLKVQDRQKQFKIPMEKWKGFLEENL